MRYLDETLAAFTRDKFVMVSGPRQVGKTTLAEAWRGGRGRYLNWDVAEDRGAILQKDFSERVVLDELHKYARWKSWLKGLYDKHHAQLQCVVTGSARLDVFQRGGDSLLGRYELLRLHPLSVGEVTHGGVIAPPANWLKVEPRAKLDRRLWAQLERRSGFPEPFYKDDNLQHRRWSTRRRELLVQQDLRELSQIRALSLVEHLVLMLPARVGAPLSVNSLREELQTAYDTTVHWLDALERLYLCFRVPPYSKKIARSLKKEQKLYLWDWSQVKDPAARFENQVACHLLKSVHAWNDLGYGEYSLAYHRDLEKREVDFIVLESRAPVVLIECKLSDRVISPSLSRLAEMLDLPAIQLVATQGVDERRGRYAVVSADRYLSAFS